MTRFRSVCRLLTGNCSPKKGKMSAHRHFDSDASDNEDDNLFKGYNDEDEDADDADNKLLAEEEEDSDDDVPEDVGFGESKQSVLDTVKAAMKQIEQQKMTEKQKRKKRQDLYTDQKKQKLEKLEKLRLPDSILDSIEDKPMKKIAKKKSKKQEEEENDVVNDDDEDEGIQMEAADLEERLDSGDFIPLASGEAGVKAVCLQEELKKPRSSMQKAADFMNSRLQGKHINRQSAHSMILQKQKKKARLNAT